jgi:hypothetical protein
VNYPQQPYQPGDNARQFMPPPAAGPPNQQPYAAYPPPPPPPRRQSLLWPILALVAAVLFLAGGAATLYHKGIIFKDSGVEACEAMAAGDQTFTGDQQSETPMDDARYRELRAVFEESRHDDIKDHGTKLMDVVWQVSQLTRGGDAGMEVLTYMQPLTTHMTGLQSACADQGVIVTLPKN